MWEPAKAGTNMSETPMAGTFGLNARSKSPELQHVSVTRVGCPNITQCQILLSEVMHGANATCQVCQVCTKEKMAPEQVSQSCSHLHAAAIQPLV